MKSNSLFQNNDTSGSQSDGIASSFKENQETNSNMVTKSVFKMKVQIQENSRSDASIMVEWENSSISPLKSTTSGTSIIQQGFL